VADPEGNTVPEKPCQTDTILEDLREH